MKKKTIKRIVTIAVIAVVLAVIFIVRGAKSGNKELVIRTHVIGNYTVENTVTATGTIEPVETVEVGTQVSGKVETIYVDFNSVVKKGAKRECEPCQGQPRIIGKPAEICEVDIRAYTAAL